jgi:hypothetical protein
LSLPPLTLFTRFSKGEEGSLAIALDSHITESAVILGNSYILEEKDPIQESNLLQKNNRISLSNQ